MPEWVDRAVLLGYTWIAMPMLSRILPGVPRALWPLAGEALRHVLASDDRDKAVGELETKVRECTGTGCPPETMYERIQP